MLELIGTSPALIAATSLAKRVATSPIPILILGENGTGKEVLARQIHTWSARKGEFVAVNCGAIPESLLESTLFGYAAGSFTGGAKGGAAGVFDAAHEGTLLLDEIGDMPHTAQVKLLRVLEDGKVTPVGAPRAHAVNVRVLAATNCDLNKMRHEKRFREDLFWRLHGVSVKIPPLRERTKDDITALAQHYARSEVRIHADALAKLHAYSWPGNIRELRSVMMLASCLAPLERGVLWIGEEHLILAEDAQLTEMHLERVETLPAEAHLEEAQEEASKIEVPLKEASKDEALSPPSPSLVGRTEATIRHKDIHVWAYASMQVRNSDGTVGFILEGSPDGVLHVSLGSAEDFWAAEEVELENPHEMPTVPLSSLEHEEWMIMAQLLQEAER